MNGNTLRRSIPRSQRKCHGDSSTLLKDVQGFVNMQEEKTPYGAVEEFSKHVHCTSDQMMRT